ncbi:hypothetical protein DMP23_30870 [Amycolatopsis sp. A1MSW2902]|uniref:toll/interleukin-1 receptor domain-containing protein n=1 Tax=Amycolatopsis sp. A1MSW2902 TaxID=687413 RepID=UPI0030A32075
MSIFVSYSRADNTLGRLAQLRDYLTRYSDVYVDDLDWMTSGVGRLESVYSHLLNASAFVAVVSESYRKTAWTAWEFNFATSHDIPKFAYLPDCDLVNERSKKWPFSPLCDGLVSN